MRKATLALIVSVLALAMAMPAAARAAEEPNEASQESSARGVSLGLLGGVNWQINDGDRTLSDLSEAYGFFVDIPIISTFYIAPEALIYRINFIKGSQPDGEYGRGITELTSTSSSSCPWEPTGSPWACGAARWWAPRPPTTSP